MAAFEMLRTTKAKAEAGILLLLLGAVVPARAFPQETFVPTANSERQRQVIDEIDAERSQNGPYSSALIEPWTQLALLYQEDGSRALAIAAFEQARQVVRANYGLHTVKEAQLIRQEMHDETARGDSETAWRLEKKMLALARRHPEDVSTVPMLREAADERVSVLDRYRAGEFPPQIYLGCYYDWRPGTQPDDSAGNCSSGDRDAVIRALETEAKIFYAQAIDVLRRNRRYSSPDLRALETRLIRLSYSSHDYLTGKRSYRRLVSYNSANAAPWLSRVRTFVEMTDWDLMFSLHSGLDALDDVVGRYEQAYGFLEKMGIAQSAIEEIFAPKTPIPIPTFEANPLASQGSPTSAEHIDAAFEITRYGKAEHIRILDDTSGPPSDAAKDLVRLIRAGRYRPIVKNGRVQDGAAVALRYYPKD